MDIHSRRQILTDGGMALEIVVRAIETQRRLIASVILIGLGRSNVYTVMV